MHLQSVARYGVVAVGDGGAGGGSNPGKPYVGLELPNKWRQTVYLREVLDCEKFRDTALALVLGKDIGGQPVIADLGKMPHLLVVGTTGSGKLMGINIMILSIATPTALVRWRMERRYKL